MMGDKAGIAFEKEPTLSDTVVIGMSMVDGDTGSCL